MRWCSWTSERTGGAGRLGVVRGRDGEDWLLDVATWAAVRGIDAPADVVDLVEATDATKARIAELAATAPDDAPGWLRLSAVRLLAPLRAPNALRGFVAYRDHVEATAARRDAAVPAEWDRAPVYAKGNRRSIVGPDDDVRWPSYAEELDYECEVAAVAGRAGRDWTPEQAGAAIFGYVLLNDWTARDVETVETRCGLGPAKAKDFATSLGPWVVTPDEWDPEGGHDATVLVDGEPWSVGTTKGRTWTFGELVAHVSRDEDVHPTDVFGSGPFPGGCGADVGLRLRPGQRVALRVAGLGELVNRVVR